MIRMPLLMKVLMIISLMFTSKLSISQDEMVMVGEWSAIKTFFKGIPELGRESKHPCHTILLNSDSTFILKATDQSGDFGWKGNWRVKKNRLYFFNRKFINSDKNLDDINYEIRILSDTNFNLYFQNGIKEIEGIKRKVKVFVKFERQAYHAQD